MRTPRWSTRRGCLRIGGAGIALAMVASGAPVARAMVPVSAQVPAALLAAPLTPEGAEVKRTAIRNSVKSDVDGENFAAAGDGLLQNAKLLGDPVTAMEAGEMYIRQAKKDRDTGVCEQADEATRVALDILYFYDEVSSGKARSTWQVIDPSSASDLIQKAEAQLGTCEEKVAALPAETAPGGEGGTTAAATPGKPPKQPREKKPGTGLIVGGAVATAVGVGGVALVIAGVVIGNGKQSEVEELDPDMDMDQIDTLDKEGARANLLAFVGAGVGVVGLAVGIPLLIVGAKKRKQGAPPANARLQVQPMLSRTSSGLSLSGRF